MFIDNDCWLKVLHLNMNIACYSVESNIFRGVFHIDFSFSVILQEIEILRWYFGLLFKLSTNYMSASLVSVVKNSPANAGDVGSIPWWEDPLEEEMAPHSSILAWEFHGQRSLTGYTVHRVAKSQTQLSD